MLEQAECVADPNPLRFPHYSPSALTMWYNSKSLVHTANVLATYFRDRTAMTLDMLEKAETRMKMA